jgi:glycogen debranching enzyme
LGDLFEAAALFGLRLPELFCGFERAPGEAPVAYPVACLPQAWAAGSVFMMLQSCLGVRIDAARQRLLIDRPRLPLGIESIQVGNLAIGAGRVDLSFQRIGSRVVAFAERREATASYEGPLVELRL